MYIKWYHPYKHPNTDWHLVFGMILSQTFSQVFRQKFTERQSYLSWSCEVELDVTWKVQGYLGWLPKTGALLIYIYINYDIHWVWPPPSSSEYLLHFQQGNPINLYLPLLLGAKPEIYIPRYPVHPNVDSEDQIRDPSGENWNLHQWNSFETCNGWKGELLCWDTHLRQKPPTPPRFGLVFTCFCWGGCHFE